MACSEQEFHYNDIGTAFLITIKDCVSGVSMPFNVSGASDIKLIFSSPAGNIKTKNASFTNDGSDGKIQYVTASGDLDEVGMWKLQAAVTLPFGSWHTDIGTFKVHCNL